MGCSSPSVLVRHFTPRIQRCVSLHVLDENGDAGPSPLTGGRRNPQLYACRHPVWRSVDKGASRGLAVVDRVLRDHPTDNAVRPMFRKVKRMRREQDMAKPVPRSLLRCRCSDR